MSFKASAPGSLMLLGEYAVLYGKQALVCAVDQRIYVTVTPRHDDQVNIHSERFGEYRTTLTDLEIQKPYSFVLGTLLQLKSKMRRGCDLYIESEFSDQIGFGSSSAVTVATLAALITWLDIRMNANEMIRQSRLIVRRVQGMGSGADVAAAVCGGMVAYQPQPLVAEKLPSSFPITTFYAGFKTPTKEAVASVLNRFSNHPDLLRSLCQSIGQCAFEGIAHARKGHFEKLGEVMNIQQGLMDALGVNLPVMQNIITYLRDQPGIVGAKISGSGMGDCVVGLGDSFDDFHLENGVKKIPVRMTLQGVQCDKL